MLRTSTLTIFMLALVLAPSMLSAQALGTGGERRGTSDPNGLPVTSTAGPDLATETACQLGSCGEIGGVIDPNGLPAASRSGPGGIGSGGGGIKGVVETDRLTAATVHATQVGMFLEWLRALWTL